MMPESGLWISPFEVCIYRDYWYCS